MPAIEQIKTWVIQHLEGTLSDANRKQLMDWVEEGEENRMAVAEFLEEAGVLEGLQGFYQSRERIWNRLNDVLGEKFAPAVPVLRLHFLRRTWWAAAAVFLVLASATWLWFRPTPPKTVSPIASTQPDILPGGNRALLTLANGQKIILDSAANGTLARQGSVTILKPANGQLQYQGTDKAIAYNTLSTPRGGQYAIQLPDGTNVWLNASSSITYPTAFTGHERNVTITGEAYFEVMHNAKMPFKVKVGAQTIEDIGTAFNINAYPDEPLARTTLITGSIRLALSHDSATLKPGQQARIKGQELTITSDVDIDQAIAWKNGIFNFTHADLPAVLRQLSRWYDLDVQYQGAMPVREFVGKLPRDLNLSQVLKVLTEMDIKYKLEGHALQISQ